MSSNSSIFTNHDYSGLHYLPQNQIFRSCKLTWTTRKWQKLLLITSQLICVRILDTPASGNPSALTVVLTCPQEGYRKLRRLLRKVPFKHPWPLAPSERTASLPGLVAKEQSLQDKANNFHSRWLQHSLQKAAKNHFCL